MNTIRTAASRMANRRRAAGLRSGLLDRVFTLTAAFDSYRPELHYMRGPGPKWHAKHNPSSAASVGEGIPALVRVRAR